MDGRPIAALTRAKGRLSLTYAAETLARYPANTPLISLSLPVFPHPHKHPHVMPLFDGLLPEGEARRMLAYDFRLAEDDTFGLLKVLGRDCAGALVLLPPEEQLPDAGLADGLPLAPEEVATRIRQLETEPLGVDQRVRISLAGVQHKLVLTKLPSGAWALPIDGLPSTHLLKRATPRFPHMVANEALCLAIGRALGLDVVEAEIAPMPEAILVVTRYDRRVLDDGRIARIHQEDLTQALSIGSAAKYEERGGPSLGRIARLLRTTDAGSENLLALLDATFLNMAIGNADAHAKNFSLLHPSPGAIRLAPVYDIMSTTYYPEADLRPAMAVNGKTNLQEIRVGDVCAEATSWGLGRNQVEARVTDLLQRLPTAIAAGTRRVPGAPPDLVTHLETRARAFSAAAE
jgi:serine/threonine-protein kinase HipA